MEHKKQNFKQNYLVIITMGVILITLGLEVFHIQVFTNELANTMTINSVFRFALSVLFILFLINNDKPNLLKIPKPYTYLLLFIPGLIISINNFPISAYFNGRTEITEPAYMIPLFLVECISTGFFEEIIFRVIILTLCLELLPKTKQGLVLSVILSSAVFGLVHLLNLFSGFNPFDILLQVGYSFLIGMFYAVMYLKTRNLWGVIILHATYNFFGQVMFQLGTVHNRYDSVTLIVTVALAVLVFVYSLFLLKTIEPEAAK